MNAPEIGTNAAQCREQIDAPKTVELSAGTVVGHVGQPAPGLRPGVVQTRVRVVIGAPAIGSEQAIS